MLGWWLDAVLEKGRQDGGGGIGDHAADRMADARMEARMEAEQEEARLERYPEGLILVDSMAFVRNYLGPHEFGPEELSLKLALEYNIKARVVAQGGLELHRRCGRRRTYQDVLEWGMSDEGAAEPEFAVVVSGGNDVYGAPDSKELYDGVGRLAEKLRILRVPSLVVFGGSSKTWKLSWLLRGGVRCAGPSRGRGGHPAYAANQAGWLLLGCLRGEGAPQPQARGPL